MTARDLHKLACWSCRRGDTWPLGAWHVPIVTGQYLREQAALREHRAMREAARAVALRGHVQTLRGDGE